MLRLLFLRLSLSSLFQFCNCIGTLGDVDLTCRADLNDWVNSEILPCANSLQRHYLIKSVSSPWDKNTFHFIEEKIIAHEVGCLGQGQIVRNWQNWPINLSLLPNTCALFFSLTHEFHQVKDGMRRPNQGFSSVNMNIGKRGSVSLQSRLTC